MDAETHSHNRTAGIGVSRSISFESIGNSSHVHSVHPSASSCLDSQNVDLLGELPDEFEQALNENELMDDDEAMMIRAMVQFETDQITSERTGNGIGIGFGIPSETSSSGSLISAATSISASNSTCSSLQSIASSSSTSSFSTRPNRTSCDEDEDDTPLVLQFQSRFQANPSSKSNRKFEAISPFPSIPLASNASSNLSSPSRTTSIPLSNSNSHPPLASNAPTSVSDSARSFTPLPGKKRLLSLNSAVIGASDSSSSSSSTSSDPDSPSATHPHPHHQSVAEETHTEAHPSVPGDTADRDQNRDGSINTRMNSIPDPSSILTVRSSRWIRWPICWLRS